MFSNIKEVKPNQTCLHSLVLRSTSNTVQLNVNFNSLSLTFVQGQDEDPNLRQAWVKPG